MSIFVRSVETNITYTVADAPNVGALRAKLVALGVPDPFIVCCGRELADDAEATAALAGTQLYVTARPPAEAVTSARARLESSIAIKVRCVRGGLTFSIAALRPSTTIREVKALIFARLPSRSVDAQRLIFVGKEMDDAKALGGDGGCGVADGSTLHLAERTVRTKLAAALHALKEGSSAEAHRVALKTLSAIVRNVVQKPGQEKYRRLRASNAAFKRKFGGLPGSDRVLFAIGFKGSMQDGQRYWTLPATALAADLAKVTAVLAAEVAAAAPAPGAAAAAPAAWAPAAAQRWTPPPPRPAGGGGGMGGVGNLDQMASAMRANPQMREMMDAAARNPQMVQMAQQLGASMAASGAGAGDFGGVGTQNALAALAQNPQFAALAQNPQIQAFAQQMAAGGGLAGGFGAPAPPALAAPAPLSAAAQQAEEEMIAEAIAQSVREQEEEDLRRREQGK
jgi:hypothetical protein